MHLPDTPLHVFHADLYNYSDSDRINVEKCYEHLDLNAFQRLNKKQKCNPDFCCCLSLLKDIVEAPCKELLNFDVCVYGDIQLAQ